jgi:hypothetical protein
MRLQAVPLSSDAFNLNSDILYEIIDNNFFSFTIAVDTDFSPETAATDFLQNVVIPEATKIFTDESQKGECACEGRGRGEWKIDREICNCILLIPHRCCNIEEFHAQKWDKPSLLRPVPLPLIKGNSYPSRRKI